MFVFTDFGEGTMTSSGYPRIVKLWTRGAELKDAEVVYEGKPDDMFIGASHDDSPGFERNFVTRALAFYNNELLLRSDDGKLTKVDVPNSASKAVFQKYLLVELRKAWEVGGKSYKPGSLLVADFDAFMKGDRDFDVAFEPTENSSLASFAPTKDHLVINVLEDVKNRVYVLTPEGDGWKKEALVGAPEIGTVGVRPVDSDTSNAFWMTSSGYLNPTTLYHGVIGQKPEQLKQLTPLFDATGLKVSQHFATSKDGTKVPYFMVAKSDINLNADNPTLLYGYGGFQVPLNPVYAATRGKLWIERGGVYVHANIRGGGEFGPNWHQAGLKTNRQCIYDDFIAIAQDLIDRQITSPKHLGIEGGSNGGLLVGVMLTQR